jgi:hypothetical protein
MNVTNSLPNVYPDKRIIYGDKNGEVSKEAFNYLTNLFPGIVYNEEDDSYEYKGYKFDYFMSGTCIDSQSYIPNGKYVYSLVHKDNDRNWLVSPERWGNFIEMDKLHKEIIELDKPKKSIFNKIKSFVWPTARY